MATSHPIPVLLCGKFPSHTKATTEILQPEFQVIKICTNPTEATAAVTALLSPSLTVPVTLDGVEYTEKPRVIIMGGGYSHADFSSIRDAVAGAKSVPWVRPEGTRPGGPERLPARAPPAGEIAARVRRTLDEHLGELREGRDCAGQVWWM
ncbi:hypothetical protein KJ359_004824 [Pestalotiopsis sp. 9143b]|nr:hypothetical protein KJ359_004824 [Pestalotiopsis sp. 9143b]